MSDLLSSLSTAARALDAQRYGLDVVGQNLSNVNTPGYSRRAITLAEVRPVDASSPGGGVEVLGVSAARTPLLDGRLYRERPAAGREGAVADQLAVIETALGSPGASLDRRLSEFFDAFAELAEAPTSSVARQRVSIQGESLAQTLQDLSAKLTATQRDVDVEARAVVEQINTLAGTIASLNVAIGNAPAGSADALRDRQATALQSLAGLIDIGVIPREDGGTDVAIGNGRALVAGERAYALTTASAPPQGFAAIVSGTTDVTGEITGGRVGGLLLVRDALAPAYLQQLDELAFGLVSDVNALHMAGYDLNGATGTALFVPLAQVGGAAAALAMNPAVITDNRRIAAAAIPASGDNQNARAIAALRLGSPSPIDDWGALVHRIGAGRRAALSELATREDVLHQLESLRSQISGVSIDEEAAMMLRFQRAYEANARFFSVVDGLLDVLMTKVGS